MKRHTYRIRDRSVTDRSEGNTNQRRSGRHAAGCLCWGCNQARLFYGATGTHEEAS